MGGLHRPPPQPVGWDKHMNVDKVSVPICQDGNELSCPKIGRDQNFERLRNSKVCEGCTSYRIAVIE